jgi:hypothetical protein
VACNEDAPGKPLPRYPDAPEKQDAESLRVYVAQQYEWAMDAVSSLSVEKRNRKATSDCLKTLRVNGVIK